MDGSKAESIIPIELTTLKEKFIIKLKFGSRHCLALTNNGEIFSWGSNNSGALGNNQLKESPIPQQINFFNGIKIENIDCGMSHSVAYCFFINFIFFNLVLLF